MRIALYLALLATAVTTYAEGVYDTDLLIVGGTESGCAAAIQAARMGVESVTIVSDTASVFCEKPEGRETGNHTANAQTDGDGKRTVFPTRQQSCRNDPGPDRFIRI